MRYSETELVIEALSSCVSCLCSHIFIRMYARDVKEGLKMIAERVGGDVFLVRLDDGQEVHEALSKALTSLGVSSAVIIGGIGMLRNFEVGWFNVERAEYEFSRFEPPHELLSTQGNVALMDGKLFAHLHVSLAGRDKRVVGGHLRRGEVCNTLELFLISLDAQLYRGGSGTFRPLEVKRER